MLYFTMITTAVLLILFINIPFFVQYSLPIGLFFVYFILSVAICGLISFVIMLIVHRSPKKLFNPYSKIFKTYKFENTLFNFLCVKKWKDKVPELGKLGGFEKNKLQNPKNSEYLHEFLVDSCKSETIHTLSAIFGLTIFFIIPSQFTWVITFPVFLVNFICHYMPSIIQRYMRPRLIKLYEKVKLRQEIEIVKDNDDNTLYDEEELQEKTTN